MKKKFFILFVSFILLGQISYAAPSHIGPGPGSRPMVHAANYRGGMRGHAGMHRPPSHPPVHMGIRPIPHPRPPMHHIMARPPLPPPVIRPFRPVPIFRPYFYSSIYYPYTYYSTTYYPVSNYIDEDVVPVSPEVNTIVVRDNYAGINTAANILNAAANVASTIRFLTW